MQTLSLGGRGLVAALLVATLVACGDADTRLPTSPTPGPGSPSAATLEITGPARMAPGESAQFAVNAPPSATVRWISSPPSFLQIDARGLATAGPLSGGAAVAAEITTPGPGGGVTEVRKSVLVMPDGTHILSGHVTDAEFRATPILEARVEVTPGSFVTMTSNGYYRFYGVPSDADLRVTADGYDPWVQRLTLTGNATQNVELTPSGPRLNLAGTHTLTIDAAGNCSLAAELHRRRYDAVVTQNGLELDVALTEPRFRLDGAGSGSRFPGRITTSGAIFTLRGLDWEFGGGPIPPDIGGYPTLVERLSNGTFLVVAGTAATTGSSAGVSGTLRGGLTHWDSRFPSAPLSLLGSCDDGQFMLTRR